MELFSLRNPNPCSLFKPRSTPPLTLSASSSLRFRLPLSQRCSLVPLSIRTLDPPPRPGFGFCSSYCQGVSPNRCVVAFAASHEETKQSEVEVDKEKSYTDAEGGVSQEAWKQALSSFKEQAFKMQSLSLEAYRVNSQKAMVTLKETSEQLRIQAEKTKEELSAVAKEMGEEGREYFLKVTEDSPADVKEIVQAFASTDDLKGFSRFGVILGGALFVLSLASFKSQKREESFTVFLIGQAAITAVIFFRELRLLLSQRSTFLGLLTTLVSGGVVAFYAYKIADKKGRGPDVLQHGPRN